MLTFLIVFFVLWTLLGIPIDFVILKFCDKPMTHTEEVLVCVFGGPIVWLIVLLLYLYTKGIIK